MRIRKRPHLSSSSPLSSSLVVSDPSLPLPPPQSGTREGLQKEREETGEGLHPDGDLTILEPHHGLFFLGEEDPTDERGLKDPPLSTNPYPRTVVDPSHISTCCITPPNTTHADQLLMKDEKEGEKMLDSRRRWDAQVNSNKRIGSGSSSREKALSHRKRNGVCNDGGRSAEVSEENPVKKEKKPMGRARANAASPIDDHCTADNGGGGSKEGDGEGSTKEEKGGASTASASAGKKRRSPAVLMEGSRCSRVNGRGWRCCQQTLVGYSLCEHHLGKGRLKSMSSVRGQLGVTAKLKRSAPAKGGEKDGPVAASSSSQELLEQPKKQQLSSEADNRKEVLLEEAAEGEEIMKAVIIRGSKKKKIGTVKARSISSLLDKTNGSHPKVSSTVSPPPSSPSLDII